MVSDLEAGLPNDKAGPPNGRPPDEAGLPKQPRDNDTPIFVIWNQYTSTQCCTWLKCGEPNQPRDNDTSIIVIWTWTLASGTLVLEVKVTSLF